MDIFDTFRVFLRWWFVVLPMTVLTVVAAVVLSSGVEPEYVAEGSVIFVGPLVRDSVDFPGQTESVNPLLDQPAALSTAVIVSALSMNGPEVSTILAQEGLSTDYEVGNESRTPILLFIVRAETRELATATALRLIELIEEDVQLRQDAADVPERQRVTTNVIGLSASSEADFGARTRFRLVIVAMGLAASAALAFLLDGIRRRRATLRSEAAGDSNPTGPTPLSRSTTSNAADEDVEAQGHAVAGTADEFDSRVDDATRVP